MEYFGSYTMAELKAMLSSEVKQLQKIRNENDANEEEIVERAKKIRAIRQAMKEMKKDL